MVCFLFNTEPSLAARNNIIQDSTTNIHSSRREPNNTNKQKQSKTEKNKDRWQALMNWDFMAIPYFGYSPETSWQFGITGVYYFKTRNSLNFSDLNFDMGYSLNKQWYIKAQSRINFYTYSNRWYLDCSISAKKYPDKYWGIGLNNKQEITQPFDIESNFVNIEIKPTFYLTKYWLVGYSMRGYISNTSSTTPNIVQQQTPSHGFGKLTFFSVGASILYDSRSNTYYPDKGVFFKISPTYNQEIIYSKDNSLLFQIDYRQYIALYKQLILAWNVNSQFSMGDNIPFQLMPTIGGQDNLRGIRQNQYKDDCAIAIQTELRIPIWKFLKMSGFCSIGNTYNYKNWQWDRPKIGYGIGLRACIHQAKTNIRFDVARQNFGNNWSFYFTVKEAF